MPNFIPWLVDTTTSKIRRAVSGETVAPAYIPAATTTAIGGVELSDAAPPQIGTSGSQGSSTDVAREDHTHAHGAQSDPSLHANAVAGGNAGFMTGADKTKLDGINQATGSTTVAAGTSGLVPAPPSNTPYRALRGDMTFSTSLQVSSIVNASNTEVVSINAFGDLGCKPFLAASDATGQKSRVGSTGSSVSNIDYQIEPKSYGRITRLGDPVPQTLKPIRRAQAIAYLNDFGYTGLPSANVSAPGGTTKLEDADGAYINLAYDGAGSDAMTFEIPEVTQRRWDPELIVVFRASFTTSRFWCGLFDACPKNLNALGTIKGCGFRFTASTDSNQYRLVTSDGTTQTTTASGIAPAANTIQALRIRHVGSGSWDFAVFDYATSSWQWSSTQATGPAASDPLSIWITLDNDATVQSNKAVGIKIVDLFGE